MLVQLSLLFAFLLAHAQAATSDNIPHFETAAQFYSVQLANDLAGADQQKQALEDLAANFVSSFNDDEKRTDDPNQVRLSVVTIDLDPLDDAEDASAQEEDYQDTADSTGADSTGGDGTRTRRRLGHSRHLQSDRTGQVTIVGTCFDCNSDEGFEIDPSKSIFNIVIQEFLYSESGKATGIVSLTPVAATDTQAAMVVFANGNVAAKNVGDRINRGTFKASAISAAIDQGKNGLAWLKKELNLLLQTEPSNTEAIQTKRVDIEGLTAKLDKFESEQTTLLVTLGDRRVQLRQAQRQARKAGRMINLATDEIEGEEAASTAESELMSILRDAASIARAKNIEKNLEDDAI